MVNSHDFTLSTSRGREVPGDHFHGPFQTVGLGGRRNVNIGQISIAPDRELLLVDPTQMRVQSNQQEQYLTS